MSMKYTVYHEPPQEHDKTNGLWFFEPYNWISPVYSYGYPSKEAAEKAAKEHLKDIHDIYEAAAVRPTRMKYTVYHIDEAAEPQEHDQTNGRWFFEPYMWISPVYSYGYPTKEAAEKAAKEHLKDIDDIYEAAAIRPTKQVP